MRVCERQNVTPAVNAKHVPVKMYSTKTTPIYNKNNRKKSNKYEWKEIDYVVVFD